MASDMVEFQIQAFLTSLKEAKPKLPDDLAEEFENIEKFIADGVKKKVWSHPHASSDLLPHLNRLNDALAECTVFAEQFQDVTESFSCLNPFHKRHFIGTVRERLQLLGNTIDLFIRNFENSSSPNMAIFPTGRHTSSESIADSPLFGMDKQKEKIIKDLTSDDGYKAIGVYGICGSGKTAIIRSVLQSASVQNQFSPIIWLCLSDMDSREDAEFFEVNIVNFMLCELGCDVDRWTVIDPSLADLLKNLKDLLKSKKYLIVFDDVWENREFYSNLGGALPGSEADYNRLCDALPRGGGGKVIVTSRVKEVAQKMVGEKNLIPMKPLDKEFCKMILEHEIGLNGTGRSEAVSEDTVDQGRGFGSYITDEILEQCHGLPLAAKTLAMVIREGGLRQS